MNKILVPVDGSDAAMQALRFGIDLAKRCPGATIDVLNVQPRVESGLVRAHLSDDTIETALRAYGEDTLRPFCALLGQTGIGYQSHLLRGHIGETITRHAMDSACTEIVMGSRGMGALGNLVLGSVATQVVHLSQLPVTLVKDTSVWSSLFAPVLVPVDGSEHANRALGYVIGRAKGHVGAQVKLLNVQEPVVEWQTRGLSQEAIVEHQQEHAAQFSEIARRRLDAAGIPYAIAVDCGDPANLIGASAKSHGFAHIVMGSRGLGGMAALVLGSTAYKTIHSADVPVTVVK